MSKRRSKWMGRSWWAAQIEAQERSGQSQRVFCEARGLSISSLARWRRRLRVESTALAVRESPQFVEVELPVASGPLVRVIVGTVTVDFETLPPPGWVSQLAALGAQRC